MSARTGNEALWNLFSGDRKEASFLHRAPLRQPLLQEFSIEHRYGMAVVEGYRMILGTRSTTVQMRLTLAPANGFVLQRRTWFALIISLAERCNSIEDSIEYGFYSL